MDTQRQQTAAAQPASSTRHPEISFRYGSCSASVFVNDAVSSDGTPFIARRVVLERRYLDKAGNWQSSGSLDVNDVPKAVLALTEAYKHCLTAARADREPGEEG